MCDGYIKLNRKMLEWEWYKDSNTKDVFIHLLLTANWKDGRFMGVEIPRGSLATSYQSLADATGLTLKNVRTAVEHLKKSEQVAIIRHSKFQVISVLNYDKYQDISTLDGNQSAINRQSSGTNRRKKEGKKERIIYGFSDFEQRGYDFKSMEDSLIGKQVQG